MDVSVKAHGFDEFQRELGRLDSDKARRKTYRRIASRVQSKARSNATSGGGAYAKAKTAIRGNSSADSATIGVSNSGRVPFAQATFWGAKRRTGWYAAGKYSDSAADQFPDWVGDHWDAGVAGEGPYVINYTVAEELSEIVGEFADGIDELFARAFPD